MGILQSGRMWASSATYLNDPSELVYAVELISGQLKAQAQQASRELEKELWKRAALGVSGAESQGTFLTCFCEEDDLLSQWRGYGAREDGFSLVFDADRIGTRPDRGFELRRVIYKPAEQLTLITECLQAARRAVGRLRANEGDQLSVVSAFLSDHLHELIFAFKNPAFHEEKEWRAVHSTVEREIGRILLRPTDGVVLIPYVEVDLAWRSDLDLLPLRHIRIGPNPNRALAERAVIHLLQKHGYDHVDIQQTSIPLR